MIAVRFAKSRGRHQVLNASNGETSTYDEVGNTVFHRNPNGDTHYDAENRATQIQSSGSGGSSTNTNYYDAAGNVRMTNINGGNYGFNEVTYRDVKYHETFKQLENGWAEDADGLVGQSTLYRREGGVWSERLKVSRIGVAPKYGVL